MAKWFEKFIGSLERLINKPPYLLFVFTGSIFVITSILFKFNFDQTWGFFIYAVGGTIWRYAEKDVMGPLIEKLSDKKSPNQKYSSSDLWIRIVYHFGNFVLFIGLMHYLHII